MSTGGVRDVSISFATTLYIQVVNVATGLLAARLLLAEGRGELAALMLWPGLVAELGCLALSDAMLYRLASGASPARCACWASCRNRVCRPPMISATPSSCRPARKPGVSSSTR